MKPATSRTTEDAQPRYLHPAGSAWVCVSDNLPPNDAGIVRVRRKPDAALDGPLEWEMWASNVRMHTDEVGWWMPNAQVQQPGVQEP